MKHFYFRLPGWFYPADIYAKNIREARKKVLEWYCEWMGRDFERLPRGTEIWESSYRGTWDVEFQFLRKP